MHVTRSVKNMKDHTDISVPKNTKYLEGSRAACAGEEAVQHCMHASHIKICTYIRTHPKRDMYMHTSKEGVHDRKCGYKHKDRIVKSHGHSRAK
jgi:hypothetical protein